jgi:DnaK suppressor protein
MNEGTYGVCLHCDEDISAKRLSAVPWAAYCINCQELVDSHQVTESEDLEDVLVNAA